MKNYKLLCLRNLLLRKKIKVSVAESCTGGELSSALTSIPGSSGYFVLGLVVYQTEMKEGVLGVSHETIRYFSVYSPEVAYEMAKNVKRLSNSDIGISTTGEFNGHGYLYFCIYQDDNNYTLKRIEVFGDRVKSKFEAVNRILNSLLGFVLNQP
ncbi:MAG: FeGP cofactor biosynthesis protein HcgF family protein [candidate division WOR-3 bacterium]